MSGVPWSAPTQVKTELDCAVEPFRRDRRGAPFGAGGSVYRAVKLPRKLPDYSRAGIALIRSSTQSSTAHSSRRPLSSISARTGKSMRAVSVG